MSFITNNQRFGNSGKGNALLSMENLTWIVVAIITVAIGISLLIYLKRKN